MSTPPSATTVAAPNNEATLDMIDKLSDAQTGRIAELRQKVEPNAAKLSPAQKFWWDNYRTVFLVRHLIARKWDINNAYAMIMAAAEWRNKSGIDTKPLFPAIQPVRGYDMDELVALRGCGARDTNAEVDYTIRHLQKIAAAAWHKWDKNGRPVYYERTGHFKVRELVERLKSIVRPGSNLAKLPIEVHIHSNEIGGVLVRYCNNKGIAKSPNSCVTIIMDAEGLSTEHLYGPALDILKTQGKNDEKYYAEGLYRLYVVNCPTVISAAWQIIKLWIDDRTKQKIHFVKPNDTKKTLLEVIDAENLPQWLGGNCKCEGGCVPDVGEQVPEDIPLGPVKEINVKAGAKEIVEVPVNPENKVQYFLNIDDNDVNFTAAFEGKDDKGKQIVVKNAEKHKGALKGDFDSAPSQGKLVFTFDNSYSWMKSKTLNYLILVDGKPWGAKEGHSPLVQSTFEEDQE